MSYNRDLARRNIAVTIKRTEAALASARTRTTPAIFPGAADHHARALAEAHAAQKALDSGENPEGWS